MKVAYVVRSWPRLSQTFILNEILALERAGVDISIFAMTRGDEQLVQPSVADVRAPVRYLNDHNRGALAHFRVALHSPWRYVATLVIALTRRELLGGYTKSRPTEAFHAAVLTTDELVRTRPAYSRIHAHFAHDPALIGVLAHRLTGLPFSFTAHARDLYQIPDRALVGRAREASVIVTCCKSNVEHIANVVGPDGPPIELVYHGLDLDRFQASPRPTPKAAPLVVSVGRLVAKKGFDDLLTACRQIKESGLQFRCEIYGDGPSKRELESLRDELGLAGVVAFCGPRTQSELIDAYHRADLFALTPKVTEDGDRDGVPNVIVEAMATGVPVVSTEVGGIPEAVVDRRNGLLAAANDPTAIASCLAALLGDPSLRKVLGEAAARDASRFDVQAAARRLAELFGEPAEVMS